MADNTIGLRDPAASTAARAVPRASLRDTLATAGDVFIPTIAKGVIVRRPAVLAIAERFQLDRRAVHRMQLLRAKYGTGPLILNVLGRQVVAVFDPAHVLRILEQTPYPFETATKEKTAALAHFEPRNVLISNAADRADRRRYNEEALETQRPIHHLAQNFLHVVAEEAAQFRGRSELNWRSFSSAWFRMVRRVVFGNAAAEDHDLSAMMFRLRSSGNWAFLAPQRRTVRARLLHRIREYLEQAEQNSLAGAMSQIHASKQTIPEEQVPQWLFAFDPAGMATFRALALLATHRDYAKRVRQEIASPRDPADMPLLRAAVLESLRLWPTSPLILRESAIETEFENGTIPAGALFMIFTPFFHRDGERLAFADRFAPEVWLGKASHDLPLIPFSEGPAKCPGRELVLLLTTAMIREILNNARVRLLPSRLRTGEPIPATLNHFALRFELRT